MYNLYYKNKLINTKGAVSEQTVAEINKRGYIFKHGAQADNKRRLTRIPVKDIKIVKTFMF